MWEDFGSRQDLFCQDSIQSAAQDTFPIATYYCIYRECLDEGRNDASEFMFLEDWFITL